LKIGLLVVLAVAILGFSTKEVSAPIQPKEVLVREFLESKKSPLAPETKFLLEQKHWKLLIAISAIESQYCTRQLGNNCWGIGGDSDYKHYDSIRTAIVSANNLIEHWQERGRWLTLEDMNCHYVQPCNQNWVNVVSSVLQTMNEYEGKSSGKIHQ